MTKYSLMDPELHQAVSSGYVGVIPTDTIYGIIAHAGFPSSVERVYDIKQRDDNKPVIVLAPNTEVIREFGIPKEHLDIAKSFWPGPVSIVFEIHDDGLDYLHRNSNSLAFRVPADPKLRYFLEKTGPVIAPSANRQGEPPIKSGEEAREYFGKDIDFYVDAGTLQNLPSTLLRIKPNGQKEVLREGAIKII